jgi:2'-5' RNA ligase
MTVNKSQPIRCFIAIDVPAELKSEISSLQNSLRKLGAGIAWTRSAGLHLTLKFLGNVGQDRLPDVISGVEAATSRVEPFVVSAEGVGCFPNDRRPRVLWVGLDGGEALILLQQAVEDVMESLGFPREERKFHPHLTLGRVKHPRGVDEVVWEMQRLGFRRQEFRAGDLRLMRSDLQPTGAVYSVIHSCLFQGGGG